MKRPCFCGFAVALDASRVHCQLSALPSHPLHPGPITVLSSMMGIGGPLNISHRKSGDFTWRRPRTSARGIGIRLPRIQSAIQGPINLVECERNFDQFITGRHCKAQLGVYFHRSGVPVLSEVEGKLLPQQPAGNSSNKSIVVTSPANRSRDASLALRAHQSDR